MNAPLLLLILAASAAPFLAGAIGVYLVRLNELKNASPHKFYGLTFPNQLSADQVLDFWNSVASSARKETVVLELRSDATGLMHRLGIPWQRSALLDKLRAHIPGIHADDMPLRTQPKWTRAEEVGMRDGTRLLDVERIQSVARSVLSAFAHDIKDGDHLAVQIIVSPVGRSKQLSTTKPVRSSSWSWHALAFNVADKDEVDERRAKLSQNQFNVVMRFVVTASTDVRAKWLLDNVRKSYHELNTSTAYLTSRRFQNQAAVIDRFNKAAGQVIYPAQVNATELVALSAWPIGAPQIGGLTLGKTRYLPPNETINKDGRRLGLSYQDRPIAISAEDACRHMYIIGPSGLGKTTLLANTLQQDMERGYGAVVIESKGDLFRAALDSVPRERLDDVIVMDFTDDEYPVGLNLLHEGDPRFVVDNLLRILTHETSDTIYLRRWASNAIQTLRQTQDATLSDVLPFLNPQTPMEKAWRDHTIDQLPKNSQLRTQWSQWMSLSDSERNQRILPVENRFWSLTYSSHLARVFGQGKSTINLREVLTDNKLLFVFLPESLGSSTVSLVGGLLFSSLWDAVQTVEKDKPTYLYLDEVQKFLNLPIDLADVLSRARSFKFGLVMAHQYRSQLSPQLQAAITNAATIAAFKLDGHDANWMQNIMGRAVTPEDFMNLGGYEVIAKVATTGGSSAPTYFKTLPRFKPHVLSNEAVRRSRARYAIKADQVDKSIMKRRTAPSKPPKAKPSFGYADE